MSHTPISDKQLAALTYHQNKLREFGTTLSSQLPFDAAQILPMLGQHVVSGLSDLANSIGAHSAEGEGHTQLTQIAKRQRRWGSCIFLEGRIHDSQTPVFTIFRLEKNRHAARERRRRKQGQLGRIVLFPPSESQLTLDGHICRTTPDDVLCARRTSEGIARAERGKSHAHRLAPIGSS